jgi:hypothetical protein
MSKLFVIGVTAAALAVLLGSAAASGHRVALGARVGKPMALNGARPMALKGTRATTLTGTQPSHSTSFDSALTAASSCATGYKYAGYTKAAIPASGSSVSANVTWNSGTVYGSSSHLAGWVGVSNDSATHWVQAGVYDSTGKSLITYIEYDSDSTGHQFKMQQYASSGSPYLAKITKNASGDWTAQIGAHSIAHVPVNGMTNTQYQGESYNGTSTCNAMDYTFGSSNPWTTSNMTKDPYEAPYVVDSITSNGWRSHGS